MADTFCLRIDLAKVAAHFTAADGRPFTEAQVADWLRENDYIEYPDGWWECEEISLDLLDKSEILELREQR